ncbi:MAG: hypothetical protein GXP54_09905 [Deltaproteobacteria bacterium]|nr:hypothetical protein [Deltaproteobacteria bacterium]
MDANTNRRMMRLALFLVLCAPSAGAGADEVKKTGLTVEPRVVEADILYNGADIEVTGIVPAGSGAAVVCRGKDGEVGLKQKGKVWGVLWMNTGEVTFDGVPSFYQASTSARLADIAPADVLKRLVIGYDAVEAHATLRPEGADKHLLFTQFVKLKESEGLYSFDEGAVRLEPAMEGASRVRAMCHLPAKAQPGKYQVLLFALSKDDGKLVSASGVTLARAGTAAFISSLAVNHGLLYGVLAVLIAVAVGLLTGLVFSLGSKGAH